MARERRQFFRVAQPFEARYRLYGELGAPWNVARALNFSAGGLRVVGEDALPVGTILEIQLRLSTDPKPLVVRGHVVWNELKAAGVVESGLECLDLTPEQQVQVDRLVQFLRKSPPGSAPS